MPFFKKSADKAKPLTVAPGMYGNESPEQAFFDRTTRITVDRNHWKLATVGLGVIAVAAILTRESPPSVVKVVGVSADVTGKPITRELDAFRPDERQVQAALKDLVQRWFTVEPILTPQIESSRMAANLRSVREQMLGDRHRLPDRVEQDRDHGPADCGARIEAGGLRRVAQEFGIVRQLGDAPALLLHQLQRLIGRGGDDRGKADRIDEAWKGELQPVDQHAAAANETAAGGEAL